MMRPRWSLLALGLVLLAGLTVRFWALGRPDLVGGDEGYYGTYARNIISGGINQLVNLGREPLSPPDNKPFLFPLLLAGPVMIAGPSEGALRLVPALAGLLVALIVAGLVRRGFGTLAGVTAGIAVLLMSPLVYASRVVMGEGVLAAFGLAGVWAAVHGLEKRRATWTLFAGALWGCGFLVKLWLVGLFILPVLVALVADPVRRADFASWSRLALASLSFGIVGSVHFVLVAVLSPGTLHHWLQEYFVFSLLGRASGQEFAAYWHQPWSFYLRTTLQTCFPILPLVVAALAPGQRQDNRSVELPQLWLWGAMATELLLISFMAVKLRQYAFPLLPALAALAGIGAARLLSSEAISRWRAWTAGGCVVLAGLVIAWQLDAIPLFPSVQFALMAGAFLLGSAVLVMLSCSSLRLSPLAGLLLLSGCLAGSLGGSVLTVQRECLAHRTGYREAAAAMAPILAELSPTTPGFWAPEVPSFQFYLFRTGRYWASPYEPHTPAELLALVANSQYRAFVTTDHLELYGGAPPTEVVHWLAGNTREVTSEVERAAGGPLPIRVFVKGAGQ